MKSYPILPQHALGLLGARISLARRAREISRKELAFQTGLSMGTLGALEAGHPGVSIGALVKVLDVLNLLHELDELLKPQNDPILISRGSDKIPLRTS